MPKGAQADVCKYVASKIQECGLIHFVYRSDREASLRAMLEEAIRISGRHGTPVNGDYEDSDTEDEAPKKI